MNTIERVINILNYLATRETFVSLTEVSRHLGIGKSSVHRILSSLEKVGWVIQNPENERYTFGSGGLELGLSILSRLDLRTASLPYLDQLCKASNETAALALRVGLESIFIEQRQSPREVRHVLEMGRRFPLWAGAEGKVILAHMEERDIEAVIDGLRKAGISVLASGQALDIDRLREQLAEIKRQGYAISVGERVAGAAAVAAPIFDQNHKILGAIVLTGPLPRFGIDQAMQYSSLVCNMALQISQEKGHKARV